MGKACWLFVVAVGFFLPIVENPIHGWRCTIKSSKGEYAAKGNTAPRAICLAALKAVGVEAWRNVAGEQPIASQGE